MISFRSTSLLFRLRVVRAAEHGEMLTGVLQNPETHPIALMPQTATGRLSHRVNALPYNGKQARSLTNIKTARLSVNWKPARLVPKTIIEDAWKCDEKAASKPAYA